MPSKKKKFIDKKHAVTFHLVHRSQRDPLAADADAPQHVLFQPDAAAAGAEGVSNRREDQIKYGIYYDDDYNYLQHLRDVNELNEVGIVDSFRVGQAASQAIIDQSDSARNLIENESRVANKLSLPSSVFGSTAETGVGILNRAVPLIGPQPDLDPDIIAALDEDFDFDDPDNELEDDFMAMANSDTVPTVRNISNGKNDRHFDENCSDEDFSEEEEVRSDIADDSEADDDVHSLGEFSFSGEETKSRFTNYSMSSSVIRRNEGLTLLDERFEKFYEQFGEEDMGALDGEDIAGPEGQDSAMLQQVLDEFERENKVVTMKDTVKKAVVRFREESDGEMEKLEIEAAPERQYDCESILSTRSTLYNHPTKIPLPGKKPKKIELTKRAEIPADVLPARGKTRRQEEEEELGKTQAEVNTQRVRGESAEERRARKQTVKESRRVRREEKAANRKAFKEEKIRVDKEVMNVKQNLQNVRIV